MLRSEFRPVRYRWAFSSCRTLAYCGTVLLDGNRLTADELVRYFDHKHLAGLTAAAKNLAGFFSLFMQVEDGAILITDRVRSYPLFYQLSDAGLTVSDQIDGWSHQPQASPQQHVLKDFVSVGYVTGAQTLIASVSQVEAAHVIVLNSSGIVQAPYFVWHRQSDNSAAVPQLLAELDARLRNAIKETVNLAGKRQIVVPLSGGYDSRAILLYLKEQGCSNIVTFTFGAAKSPELRAARELAAALGFIWYPVIYTARLWRDLRTDMQFIDYLQFCSNGVSVPNVQLWPALRHLLAEKRIAADALLVPGHTGDFVSGGHLSAQDWPVEKAELPQLARHIQNKYYQLDREKPAPEIAHHIQGVCSKLWHSAQGWSAEELQEAWNWQERQSKYIVNSNRYYEFFGLEWWLPLWQKEFVDFWLAVPKVHLRQQSLWRQLIRQKCEQAGIAVIDQNAARQRERYSVLKQALNYFYDRNLLLCLIPFHQWLFYRLRWRKHSGTLNSYLARYLLRRQKISEE